MAGLHHLIPMVIPRLLQLAPVHYKRKLPATCRRACMRLLGPSWCREACLALRWVGKRGMACRCAYDTFPPFGAPGGAQLLG